MKVIKDNRPQKQFKFPLRLTCFGCKSELEADESDLKETHGLRGEEGFCVKCPLCANDNPVKPLITDAPATPKRPPLRYPLNDHEN